MRNRKYLLGALVGVIGALVFSGTAFAGTQTSQSLQTTIAPAKLSKKKFKPVSLHNIITTNYDNFVGSPAAKETVFTIDSNVRFQTTKTPACPMSSIANKPNATAQAACGSSVVGQGTALVNGGALTAKVLLIAGGANTLFVHTDISNGAIILVLTGIYTGNKLDVTGLPNTPGSDLTNFDTTFNKTGKNSYVVARCKHKNMSNSETTTYYGGPTLTASSSQKCKQTA